MTRVEGCGQRWIVWEGRPQKTPDAVKGNRVSGQLPNFWLAQRSGWWFPPRLGRWGTQEPVSFPALSQGSTEKLRSIGADAGYKCIIPAH